jgi:hypothetical protein
VTTGTQLDNLKRIRATAERVERDHAELDAAGAVLHEANAALLEATVEAHRPALRALASVVGASGTSSGAGTTVEPMPWRGVWLGGEGPTLIARESAGPLMARGRHGGTRLILDTAGTFVELSYEGPWSNVPGEVSSWTASVALLNSRTVVERYNVNVILDRLAAALLAQANGVSPERAVLLREKADRIQALTKLIRSWR